MLETWQLLASKLFRMARPAADSEALRSITDGWQQPVWDAQLLADPEVHEFLRQEGVLFTDWKEMMRRFEGRAPKEMGIEGDSEIK